MNDRLHKSIYGQTLNEMKDNKGTWEYKQDNICDTCKHNDEEWDEEPCDGCCGNYSGYEPSGDLISRQAVYHILDEVGGDFDKPREAVVPVDYIADMVGELPPVTPQSKVGHWIKENPPMVEQYPFCSECGFVNPFENALNYCPNCGARMVEPQERSDKE